MKLDATRYPARLERLVDANAFVEACADRSRLEDGKRFGALLALEEAFVNICSYAYPDSSGEVEIACGLDGGRFVLEIADWGSPFDVLSLPEPDLTLDIMERPIGGLGIHFIRVMTDSVSYRRESGRNVLRMEFAAAAG
ncbi:MAG: putative anti-sigma regulatory factor, serine/threonine protein kinase [Burkholderiaceae bacterium]|nr:putative anti-sigma regulatory factor, serine/threonine protein kinase [Burkholderiaceae bacterium]